MDECYMEYYGRVSMTQDGRRVSRVKGVPVDHDCAFCDKATAWWRCEYCWQHVHTGQCLRDHECTEEIACSHFPILSRGAPNG